MPKIPVYSYQAQPAESSKQLIKDPNDVGREESAWAQATTVATKRVEQYQQERDIIDASAALSALSDEEREMQVIEGKREGNDAVGATARGNEWYAEATKKHSGALSAGASKVFNQKALQLRDASLDRLASHEATQHQKAKQATFDKDVTDLEKTIRAGGTEKQVMTQLAITKEKLRMLHSGIDTTKMEDQLEQEVLKKFITEQAGINPGGARDLLDRYSDKLGEDTKKALGDFTDRVEIEQSVNTWYTTLERENKGNFEKMLKDVDNTPLGTKAKENLTQKIKGEFATAKAFRDDKREELGRKEQNDVVTAMATGNYSKMYELALNSKNMSPSAREHYTLQAKALQEAIITGKKSQFNVTDPQAESFVMKFIESHPHMITEADVLKLAGYGLSNDDAKKHAATLKAAQEKPNPRVAMVADALKVDAKNKLMGNELESQQRTNEALDAMRAFVKQYPDKDPYTEFYIPYKAELNKGRVRDAYAKVGAKLGTPAAQFVRPRPEQKLGRQEDFAERYRLRTQIPEGKFSEWWLGRDITNMPPLADTVIKPPKPPDVDMTEGKSWAVRWFENIFSSKGGGDVEDETNRTDDASNLVIYDR